MQVRLTGIITKGEKWYVAQCLEINVVTQGKTLEEAKANLKEAAELYLEDASPDDIAESMSDPIVYTFEVEAPGGDQQATG